MVGNNNRLYKKLLLFCIFLKLNAVAFSQQWQMIDDFPSTERDDGCVFVINENAYCGSGVTTGGMTFGDFYKLDMINDIWSAVSSLPAGEERQYACGFSSGESGFVFGGIRNTLFLNDVWKYDSNSDSWSEVNALLSSGRSGSAVFTIGDTAYIIGGKNDSVSALREVWAYDMVNDSWQRKNDLPFGGRWRSSAASMNSIGYLAFGRDEKDCFCRQLFEYNVLNDSWSQISVFPGNGRSYSSMLSIDGDLVTMAGIDTFGVSHNDFWMYDQSLSNWVQLSGLPATGRRGGMCFNYGKAIYYTTGIDQSYVRLTETWKKSSPTGLAEIFDDDRVNVFPNPSDEVLFVGLSGLEVESDVLYRILDLSGKELLTGIISSVENEINVSDLKSGIYLLSINSQKISSVKSFVRR